MGLFSNPLRVAAGIGTLGGSELMSAAGKKLGLGLEDEQGAYETPEQQAARRYQEFAGNQEASQSASTVQANRDLAGGVGGQLWGTGGLTDRLNTEEQNLAGQGFKLTDDDQTAYGQAAGDIARQFGQQEQQATQNLARRGLGSAASGAAGAAFSGLSGNKNEMLAKAQTDIAQKRMADTQQRLQATRNQLQSLGLGGQQLVNSMAQTNYSNKEGTLKNAAGVEDMTNQQNHQTLADQKAAVNPGLFSTVGQGLQAGLGNLATQAPGMAAGGLFGGGASAAAAATKK